MAGETVVETPQDNTKVEEPIKTDKEVIAEEEAAQANEVGMIFKIVIKNAMIRPSHSHCDAISEEIVYVIFILFSFPMKRKQMKFN